MDINNTFSFCPVCGSRSVASTARKWTCPDCGFDLYNNVAASVAVILRDALGNILLVERAKEPRRGFLALPGGFVDPDEGLEAAAVRECMEETHYDAKGDALSYLCSFPNSYEYRGVHYKTCDTFWTVRFDSAGNRDTADGGFDGFDTPRLHTTGGATQPPTILSKEAAKSLNHHGIAGNTSIADLITHLLRQEKEVRRFVSAPCRTPADVDAIPLAFDSAKNALRFLVTHN